MKIKSLFLMAGAAVAGIYLTSEEGKKARIALSKKKSTVEPIIKDLLKQATGVLEGSKEINSDAIRININQLVNEAKALLINLDLDKAISVSRDAIKVATKKINEASNEVTKNKRLTNTKKKKVSKPKIKREAGVKKPSTAKIKANTTTK